MIGLLIRSNLDALYLPSVAILDNVSPIVVTKLGEFEEKLVSHFVNSNKLERIAYIKDNCIIANDKYSMHPLGVNPLKEVNFVLNEYQDAVFDGISADYEFLKGIFLTEGTLNFSESIVSSGIKSYVIDRSKYPNDLSINSDPFEFLLIQLGLSRIDHYPFESDYYNEESNDECWLRYLNNRTHIYELDSLPR